MDGGPHSPHFFSRFSLQIFYRIYVRALEVCLGSSSCRKSQLSFQVLKLCWKLFYDMHQSLVQQNTHSMTPPPSYFTDGMVFFSPKASFLLKGWLSAANSCLKVGSSSLHNSPSGHGDVHVSFNERHFGTWFLQLLHQLLSWAQLNLFNKSLFTSTS